LASFKQELFNKHALLLADYTLILIGRELKDDERTLEVLGFIPGCTIHAGKYFCLFLLLPLMIFAAVAKVQFCVSTPTAGDFDMIVGPTTRISAIRKMLEEIDTDTKYDEYWFTLNGMDNLKETRTFWDLDILSGTVILLSESLQRLSLFGLAISQTILERRSFITLVIRRQSAVGLYTDDLGGHGHTFYITADENDTVENVKQMILLELDTPFPIVKLTHRSKELSDRKTLKQEELEGGAILDVVIPASPW
jgi:hypothetical protein